MISKKICHQSKWLLQDLHYGYDASYRCLCMQSSMSSSLHHILYRRLSLRLILCCPSPYCMPHAIIKCRITILITYFPCLARLVSLHLSLPAFESEIALSARTLAPSFAGSPWCAFTLTMKVAVPAAILFRNISMAAARISASGAPTNVAFPPSPIYLLTAFNNDWLSHKYNNWSSISVDRKKLPPPGGVPIYYVLVCKRTPLEEFVPGASRGVLLHTVVDEGT